jgi:S-adenosylmethionine decarboxylase proenzyme
MSENKNKTNSKLASSTMPSAEGAPYEVVISKKFVVSSLLSSILLAFMVGRTARVMILIDPRIKGNFGIVDSVTAPSLPVMAVLPDPVLKAGKTAPPTQYMSKTFDTTLSASTQSRWIVTDEGRKQSANISGQTDQCAVPPKMSPDGAEVEPAPGDDSNDDKDDEEEHLPAGQHLLMDIEHVDSDFLNSEQRLAAAMLELVDECGLTLLSYHCHKLKPQGVSCAGVLLESHVSFHTWPQEGVITLDLYTCGPKSLLPLVPLVEKLFAIPQKTKDTKPQVVWAHKIRGFPGNLKEDVAEITDMQWFPVGKMTDFKTEVSK